MKLALVVGSAACIWADAKAARELCNFDAVCCIKRAGIEWPEAFQFWATLHPEMMDDFEARRKANGLPGGYEIVAPLANEVGMHGKKGNVKHRISYRWPGMNSSAGSGLYGAKAMIDLGYYVVLAGIPMNNEPHFLKHELWGTGDWNGLDSFLNGFEKSLPFLKDKCRSMSGRTKELLGLPDPTWLNGVMP